MIPTMPCTPPTAHLSSSPEPMTGSAGGYAASASIIVGALTSAGSHSLRYDHRAERS